MTDSVSIIICTANRAELLRRCLESLRQVAFPADRSFELVVVDNASRDDTKAVCEAFVAGAPLPTRYVFEPKRGKSHALNSGIAAATGDILYFTDDDCVFVERFAADLRREFADPALDGIGGRVELYDPTDLPITTRLYDERIAFTDAAWLFYLIPGCNMAFRRRVFERIGGFDPLLGPGTPRVAEDSDFLYRALQAGCRMVYTPGLLIYHGHGRKEPADAVKIRRAYAIGRGAFYMKHLLARDRTVLRMVAWEVAGLLRLVFRTLRRGPFDREALACLFRLLRGATSYAAARVGA